MVDPSLLIRGGATPAVRKLQLRPGDELPRDIAVVDGHRRAPETVPVVFARVTHIQGVVEHDAVRLIRRAARYGDAGIDRDRVHPLRILQPCGRNAQPVPPGAVRRRRKARRRRDRNGFPLTLCTRRVPCHWRRNRQDRLSGVVGQGDGTIVQQRRSQRPRIKTPDPSIPRRLSLQNHVLFDPAGLDVVLQIHAGLHIAVGQCGAVVP